MWHCLTQSMYLFCLNLSIYYILSPLPALVGRGPVAEYINASIQTTSEKCNKVNMDLSVEKWGTSHSRFRVHLRDLPPSITAGDLAGIFQEFFPRAVVCVEVRRPLPPKFSLGYGLVRFQTPDIAASACNVKYTYVDGRISRFIAMRSEHGDQLLISPLSLTTTEQSLAAALQRTFPGMVSSLRVPAQTLSAGRPSAVVSFTNGPIMDGALAFNGVKLRGFVLSIVPFATWAA